jgi:hypothetical protein
LRPMSPFWIQKHDFWRSFWYPFFIVFLNELKSRKVFVFQYFSMVLDHPKPLIFRSFFHRFFIFFQNRFTGQFLGGPSAELFWKVRLWCHFRFSWFSKKAPLDDLFAQPGAKNLVPFRTGGVLFATLLFTKPR